MRYLWKFRMEISHSWKKGKGIGNNLRKKTRKEKKGFLSFQWWVKRGQYFWVTVWSITSQAVEVEGALRFGHITNNDLRRAEWVVRRLKLKTTWEKVKLSESHLRSYFQKMNYFILKLIGRRKTQQKHEWEFRWNAGFKTICMRQTSFHLFVKSYNKQRTRKKSTTNRKLQDYW